MTDNQKRILEMLAEHKISVDEATKLLNLTENPESATGAVSDAVQTKRTHPKYLRVVIRPNTDSALEADYDHVNVRIPMALIRAGIKLTALIPPSATKQMNEALRSKGIDIDVNTIKPEDLEQLVDALSELEVDVQSKKEKVHVFLE